MMQTVFLTSSTMALGETQTPFVQCSVRGDDDLTQEQKERRINFFDLQPRPPVTTWPVVEWNDWFLLVLNNCYRGYSRASRA